MAAIGRTNIQRRGEKYQLRITHPDLPKARFFTFADPVAAENYRQTVEAWFADGQVPPELMTTDVRRVSPLVVEVIRAYEKGSDPPPAPSEGELLTVVRRDVAGVRTADLTFQWVTDYVRRLKGKKLAPGTIRKRVGLLGRIMDHHHRHSYAADAMPANVFRMLPKGYSVYAGGEKTDTARDVRLTAQQHAQILAALDGHKREDRERPWGNIKTGEKPDAAFKLLYLLIVDTGMRLKEAYTAQAGDLDVAGRFLRVRGSKGHRGKIKWRTVPLKKELYQALAAHCAGLAPGALVFPFWNGQEDDAKKCSLRLSARFATLFDYAGVDGFKEHDLRHEACCRWVTMKDAAGRWMFTDGEVCRIMGWTDPKLLLRYMSLRGEDLSARLH